MAATYKGARRITKASKVFGSINMHHCDDCSTLSTVEAMVKGPECQSCGKSGSVSLVFPRGRNLSPESSRPMQSLMSVMIEVVFYLVIAGTTIYSVALNSLPVLMSAMIAAALYIVLSHFYEVAVKARKQVAEENYVRLMTSSFSRN